MTEYVALKAKVLTKSSIDIANGSLFEILSSFSLTCKSATITGFGQKVTLDDDERIEPGTVTVTEST